MGRVDGTIGSRIYARRPRTNVQHSMGITIVVLQLLLVTSAIMPHIGGDCAAESVPAAHERSVRVGEMQRFGTRSMVKLHLKTNDRLEPTASESASEQRAPCPNGWESYGPFGLFPYGTTTWMTVGQWTSAPVADAMTVEDGIAIQIWFECEWTTDSFDIRYTLTKGETAVGDPVRVSDIAFEADTPITVTATLDPATIELGAGETLSILVESLVNVDKNDAPVLYLLYDGEEYDSGVAFGTNALELTSYRADASGFEIRFTDAIGVEWGTTAMKDLLDAEITFDSTTPPGNIVPPTDANASADDGSGPTSPTSSGVAYAVPTSMVKADGGWVASWSDEIEPGEHILIVYLGYSMGTRSIYWSTISITEEASGLAGSSTLIWIILAVVAAGIAVTLFLIRRRRT